MKNAGDCDFNNRPMALRLSLETIVLEKIVKNNSKELEDWPRHEDPANSPAAEF